MSTAAQGHERRHRRLIALGVLITRRADRAPSPGARRYGGNAVSLGASSDSAREPDALSRARLAHLAAIAFLGALPVLAIAIVFASTVNDDSVAMDFRQFHQAGEVILDGDSPYLPPGEPLTEWGGPYPYPPLPALLAIPLTPLSIQVSGLLLMALLVGVALAVPWVLGVRDWRCYGLVLLWPPVISAIQTANLTLWFALLMAIAWRFRDRLYPVALAIGVTLAAKFFLWPVVLWLGATRRIATAIATCVVGIVLLVLSWSVLGFAGFLDYPDLLRRLEDVVGDDSYTVYIVGLDLGLPSAAARSLWALLGVGLLAWMVLLGRRGDERGAFILAIAASLALSPIVWLHYFALLVVVVALAQARLGIVWFVPLAMVITPGSGHPTAFETSWTLAVAALTVTLALRTSSARRADDARIPAPGVAAA